VRADLDTLLIAVYCAACALFPAAPVSRRGRPELISDNELLTLMVGQMLLQCPSDRVFLRRARRRLGHLFPYLLSQSRYNERCRQLAPKLVLLWKALASETFGAGDDLRLLDTTPLPCGQSIQTTRTSQLAPWAGFGYCPAHSRRYWGFKLVLLCAPDGTILDFDLVAANNGERDAALALLEANPIEGATIVCDKGFAGADFEAAVRELRALLLRPSRSDEPNRPNPPTGWMRQRIESIVNSLKDQLHLERHGGRTPAGLLARVTARILALCACINLNQRLGLPSRDHDRWPRAMPPA
jgi:Transposase DDE domain